MRVGVRLPLLLPTDSFKIITLHLSHFSVLRFGLWGLRVSGGRRRRRRRFDEFHLVGDIVGVAVLPLAAAGADLAQPAAAASDFLLLLVLLVDGQLHPGGRGSAGETPHLRQISDRQPLTWHSVGDITKALTSVGRVTSDRGLVCETI